MELTSQPTQSSKPVDMMIMAILYLQEGPSNHQQLRATASRLLMLVRTVVNNNRRQHMGKLTLVGSTLQLLEGSSNSIMINPSSSRLMEGIRTMPQRLVRQDMLREAIHNIRQPVNKQVPISNKLIN